MTPVDVSTQSSVPSHSNGVRSVDALSVLIDTPGHLEAHRVLSTSIASAPSMVPGIIPVVGPSRIGKTTLLQDMRRTILSNGAGDPQVLLVDAGRTERDTLEELLHAVTGRWPLPSPNAQATERLISELKHARVTVLLLDHFDHVDPHHATALCRRLQTLRLKSGITIVAAIEESFWRRHCMRVSGVTWHRTIALTSLNKANAKMVLEALLERMSVNVADLCADVADNLLKLAGGTIGHIATIVRLAAEMASCERRPSRELKSKHLVAAMAEFSRRAPPSLAWHSTHQHARKKRDHTYGH